MYRIKRKQRPTIAQPRDVTNIPSLPVDLIARILGAIQDPDGLEHECVFMTRAGPRPALRERCRLLRVARSWQEAGNIPAAWEICRFGIIMSTWKFDDAAFTSIVRRARHALKEISLTVGIGCTKQPRQLLTTHSGVRATC